MNWAVGVTTVPERRCTTLQETLASLAGGGFESPRLFVDGDTGDAPNTTFHSPRIGAWGNWWLALHELHIRNPEAERYVLFQDDVLCTRNLRRYLERCKYPKQGYWNLYTEPRNAKHAPCGGGWYPAMPNSGWGALALCFDAHAVECLLSSRLAVLKCRDIHGAPKGVIPRGMANIDGGVVNALHLAGVVERVHHPSLVEHRRAPSTLGHPEYPAVPGWRGEGFDLDSLPGSG